MCILQIEFIRMLGVYTRLFSKHNSKHAKILFTSLKANRHGSVPVLVAGAGLEPATFGL